MKKEKVTRLNIADHLFTYQLSLIGKKKVDIIDMDPRWQSTTSMTRVQYLAFEKYAVSLMMKVFRIPKSKAKVNFEWYWAQFGIRIKN
jgi:hypothetical protein